MRGGIAGGAKSSDIPAHCIDTLHTRCVPFPPFFPSLFAFKGLHHETHVSAEQSAPRAHPRVPSPNGNRRRSESPCASPRQGPQETRSLKRAQSSLTSGRVLRLSPALRLRSSLDFDAIYARGSRRFDDNHFSVRVKHNNLAHPRLGLAVAVKTMGSGVARNKLRRRVRESFRLHQKQLPAVDIVVGAKPAARGATPAALRDSLANLWIRIAAQCGTSSAR
jgi:ribonuclease P protein component